MERFREIVVFEANNNQLNQESEKQNSGKIYYPEQDLPVRLARVRSELRAIMHET